MQEILAGCARTLASAIELARLPVEIRGFGHVKAAAAARAARREAELLERFRAGEAPAPLATAAE